jgi:hypothetical protein
MPPIKANYRLACSRGGTQSKHTVLQVREDAVLTAALLRIPETKDPLEKRLNRLEVLRLKRERGLHRLYEKTYLQRLSIWKRPYA